MTRYEVATLNVFKLAFIILAQAFKLSNVFFSVLFVEILISRVGLSQSVGNILNLLCGTSQTEPRMGIEFTVFFHFFRIRILNGVNSLRSLNFNELVVMSRFDNLFLPRFHTQPVIHEYVCP